MYRRIIDLVIHRPRSALLLTALIAVLAGLGAASAGGKLSGGGFRDAGSESSRAATAWEHDLGNEPSNLVVLVTAPTGTTVDEGTAAGVGRSVATKLAREANVTVTGSYWSLPVQARAGMRSTDGSQALILANVAGTEDEVRARMADLSPAISAMSGDGVTVRSGGQAQAMLDNNGQVGRDLARAEAIAIPLTIALLILAFGSVVAGLLPLLVGGFAILTTFGVLGALASLTDVSIFALNLATALGLGLGIDYALLIVSRFREELATDASIDDALRVTLLTAGRTVMFSAVTVAVALACLIVFPLYFLQSFAYAGVAVVAAAAFGSLVVLPATLRLLGHRMNRWAVRRNVNTAAPSAFWSGVARVVMRRPILTAAPVLVVLAVLAVPFSGVQFGLPDDRAMAASASQARQVGDELRDNFASQSGGAMTVVLPQAPSQSSLTDYAQRLSNLEGVARVQTSTATLVDGQRTGPGAPNLARGDAAGLLVTANVDPNSAAGEQLVDDVRAVAAPGERLVGGPSAELVDVKSAIAQRLPLAIALIAGFSLITLFLFTGSVLLPVKALLLNAFTILGVLGAMVWIFVDGHGSDLLGFTPQPLNVAMPLLMFCVAFGLSMDYEVFLLGRIKELHDAGADTVTAVSGGLARTGRIVTTAAALLSVTLFAFVTSRVSFIQMLGLGTGLAIVLDATLVRGILVPALMRLMGQWNWWAPRPLRWVHRKIGLTEGGTVVQPHLTPA